MQLYFLRHGKAADVGGRDVPDDFSRPLTPEGLDELRRIGQALELLGIAPDTILTSPLVRAKQTADAVAAHLPSGRPVTADELAPGCTIDGLRKLLERHSGAESVMLVGHEPDFGRLVGDLVGSRGAAIEMKKAGLALVEIDPPVRAGRGLLRWLVPPKLLVRCAPAESRSAAS